MSIYLRGKVWWAEFVVGGRRIRMTTRQHDRERARAVAADLHVRLGAAKSDPTRVGRLRRLVDRMKSDGACSDCRGRFPPCAMQYDHVRGSKTMAVSDLVHNSGATVEQVMSEIAKCDLVCANCHAIRTAGRPHIGERRLSASPRQDPYTSGSPYWPSRKVESGC